MKKLKLCNCIESCGIGYTSGVCPRALWEIKNGTYKPTQSRGIKMAFADLVADMKSEHEAALAKFAELETAHAEEVEAAKASVPAPEVQPPVAVDPNDQAALEAALKPLQEKIAELEAKLAEPDTTPFDQKAVDEAVEKATANLKAEYEKAGEDKDAAEELIAQAMKDLAEKVSGLSKAKTAPVDGAPSESV